MKPLYKCDPVRGMIIDWAGEEFLQDLMAISGLDGLAEAYRIMFLELTDHDITQTYRNGNIVYQSVTQELRAYAGSVLPLEVS
jgi:hypothetical protein